MKPDYISRNLKKKDDDDICQTKMIYIYSIAYYIFVGFIFILDLL